VYNFSWQKFCDLHRISYVEKGPNTARGHISVKCPMCRDDPSEHMGLKLDLKNPKWGCLRNADHRGANPVYLIAELLHVSRQYALSLVDMQRPELDEFASAVESLTAAAPEPKAAGPPWWEARALEMPKKFSSIDAQGEYAKQYQKYLEGRGFDSPTRKGPMFDLRYSLSGQYKYRVILPFYHLDQLVGWTGRSISSYASLRYLTHPSPPALTNPGSYVLNQDEVEKGGGTLLMVEGPFDALKVMWYREGAPVTVSCWFGKPKTGQLMLVAQAIRRFERCSIMLDSTAQAEAFGHALHLQEISGKSVRVLSPAEFGVGDPGEMSKQKVQELLKHLTK
jgi:hypothetical protein